MDDNEWQCASLVVRLVDFGYHSTQNSYVSVFTDRCIVPPLMAIICLRCFWYMDLLKYRYLYCDKSGCQYVVRSITGLLVLINKITFSLACFGTEVSEDSILNHKAINRFMKDKLDEYDGLTAAND